MSEQPASRPGPKPLRDEPTIPVEFDDLMLLAHRYAGQGMYDEAIHLY